MSINYVWKNRTQHLSSPTTLLTRISINCVRKNEIQTLKFPTIRLASISKNCIQQTNLMGVTQEIPILTNIRSSPIPSLVLLAIVSKVREVNVRRKDIAFPHHKMIWWLCCFGLLSWSIMLLLTIIFLLKKALGYLGNFRFTEFVRWSLWSPHISMGFNLQKRGSKRGKTINSTNPFLSWLS